MNRKVALLLVMLMAALPLTVFAQDLTETYTSEDGSLTFQYPAGWVVEGFGTSVFLANTQEAADTGTENLQSGQVAITLTIVPRADVVGELGLPPDASALEFAQGVVELAGEAGVTITMQPQAISDVGVDAAEMAGIEEVSETYILIVFLDDETAALFTASAPEGEALKYQSITVEIARSVTYTVPEPGAGFVTEDSGPAPVVGSGDIQWQQVRPNEFGEGFGNLDTVVVGADDTIYIADGFNGIHVLDSAGNVLRTIKNNDITNVDDIAIATDDTLWVADSFDNMVFHIDTSGSILGSFGAAGTEPGQFGEFSPDEIELGSDGNLYLFNSRSDESGNATGSIVVFDTAGNFIREFPTDPTNSGSFGSYVPITVAPDGSIYMVEYFGPLTVLDNEGNLVRQDFGMEVLEFESTEVILVTADGFVITGGGGVIRKFDSDGNLIAQFGTRQEFPAEGDPEPQQPGEFNVITGIGILSNGDIVVADTNYSHSQVVRFTLSE